MTTRGPKGLSGHLNQQVSFQWLLAVVILVLQKKIFEGRSMKAVDQKVMHAKFGQNWPNTFREDVENTNFPYTTLQIYMVM